MPPSSASDSNVDSDSLQAPASALALSIPNAAKAAKFSAISAVARLAGGEQGMHGGEVSGEVSLLGEGAAVGVAGV